MSRALVPLAASVRAAPDNGVLGRTRADFLAQLIATVEQAPQTRTRRRADPQDAITAYGASGRRPSLARPALLRSL